MVNSPAAETSAPLYRLVRLSRLAKRLVVARLGSLRILSCLRYSRL